MKLFRRLSAISLGFAIGLVTLGTVVRVTDSGLGCPDWPRCFGSFIPPPDASALIEYSHRLVASITGFLILGLATVAWLKVREKKMLFGGSLAVLVVVGIQAWIGRQVVLGELPRDLVAVHFLTAMTVIALLSLVTTSAYATSRSLAGGKFSGGRLVGSLFGVSMTATMILGALNAQFPGPIVVLHMGSVVVTAALLIAMVIIGMRSEQAGIRWLSGGTGVAFVIQVLMGLQTFLSLGTREQAPLVIVHVFLATTIWAAAVALTVLFFKARAGAKVAAGENVEIAKGPSTSIKAYFLLTKPRIIELLLITTVPAMVVAARGWPSTTLVIATVFGGALAAGSANSINSFVDRDIDDRMERTKRRPLPQNTIKPRRALIFGITLGVIAFAFLVTFVNLLAATLATSGILFYVFVYTIWLKRSTPSNIVIGGAAGAVPPLVGWAAVTDGLSIVPLVLFAVVFYWTPPHFWALAIKYSPEYEAAGVPMLPVVRGPKETGRQIFWYSLVLLAVSLLLAPTARLGSLYLMSAIVLGAAFVFYALRVQADPTPQRAMALFRYSITYLVLIFVSMAVDASVGSPMVISEAWVFVVAAPIFLGAQAMVMFSVLGFGEFRGRIQLSGSELGAEIAWTAVPSLLVAALFVFAWQSLIA